MKEKNIKQLFFEKAATLTYEQLCIIYKILEYPNYFFHSSETEGHFEEALSQWGLEKYVDVGWNALNEENIIVAEPPNNT